MSEAAKPSFLPLMIVKRGTVSKEDIERAEKMAFICIIESDEPDAARFVEPPIQTARLDEQARAAMELVRWMIRVGNKDTLWAKGDLVKLFVDSLVNGEKPQATERVKGTK